jgi:predicted Co/Zn/Cd cation transporter (cation efflux family)
LFALRLRPAEFGTWSAVGGLTGLASCLVLWWCADRRSRRVRHALLVAAGPLPGGGLLLGVALLVAVGAAFALLAVLMIVASSVRN